MQPNLSASSNVFDKFYSFSSSIESELIYCSSSIRDRLLFILSKS